jgi:hypothetical protein
MKRLYVIQSPSDLANSYYYKAGQSLSNPLLCWYVDSLTRKIERVSVIRFRGSCDYYSNRVDYADLEDGRSVSSYYLFSQKPQLVTIEDSFGKTKQWIAGPAKLIKKLAPN